MTEFTAANGIPIRRTANGYLSFTTDGDAELGTLNGITEGQEAALREYFQHERDEELGRWRWPENQNVVVYRDGHESRRSVTIVFEETGGVVIGMSEKYLASTTDEGLDSRRAARAYFETHPEQKPWHDAKPWETWVFTIYGVEQSATIDEDREFRDRSYRTCSWMHVTDERISDARRIWPVSDD